MNVSELKEQFEGKVDFSAVPEDYLQKVLDFAESRALTNLLLDRFRQISAAKADDLPTKVYQDWAPYSFVWQEFWGQSKGLFGGLIYHGAGDTGFGAPTLSGRIGQTNEDWGIHT